MCRGESAEKSEQWRVQKNFLLPSTCRTAATAGLRRWTSKSAVSVFQAILALLLSSTELTIEANVVIVSRSNGAGLTAPSIFTVIQLKLQINRDFPTAENNLSVVPCHMSSAVRS